MPQRTPYSRPQPQARTRTERHKASDKRYGSRRWKLLAARVRRRDGLCRIVPGCPKPAQVADHVFPVYEGMPDAEFYDERNLRGGCKGHNTLRGQADKAARELGEGGRFFSRPGPYERPLANLHTQKSSVVHIDFTRPASDGR